MSPSLIARGMLKGCMPKVSVYISPGQASACGPKHFRARRQVRGLSDPARVHELNEILPSLRCTASVTISSLGRGFR